jgi:tripartite-type tricarboxylate transporter receptor subunit TctC
MAQVQSMFGLDMVHVPYKGEPPATVDLTANRVQVMIGTGAGLSFVKQGKLRALVAFLPERSPLAPDVPALHELGMGNLPVELWAAIVGPAGMPKDVVERLNKAFVAALSKPDIKAQIESWGFAVTPSRPEELGALLKGQAVAYKKLIEAIGMPVQ